MIRHYKWWLCPWKESWIGFERPKMRLRLFDVIPTFLLKGIYTAIFQEIFLATDIAFWALYNSLALPTINFHYWISKLWTVWSVLWIWWSLLQCWNIFIKFLCCETQFAIAKVYRTTPLVQLMLVTRGLLESWWLSERTYWKSFVLQPCFNQVVEKIELKR